MQYFHFPASGSVIFPEISTGKVFLSLHIAALSGIIKTDKNATVKGELALQMHIEQSLKQTIRPQMIQSAQILQLTTVELQQYLEDLSLENPLMEFLPPTATELAKSTPIRCADEQNRAYDRQEQENDRDPWNSIARQEETLTDVLLFQLNGLSLEPRQRQILAYMIHNLDANGYLGITLAEVQEAFQCEETQVSHLLTLLQAMEPCGVGARNLSECLCLQLAQQHPGEHTALTIARDYLELLGKNQLPALAKKLHVSMEEVGRSCDLIRTLNPRPGSAYGDDGQMAYITPELLVFQNGDGFRVLLNDYSSPTLSVNPEYLTLLQQDSSPETTEYLSRKKAQLEWVQQCIRQRSETLLAIGELILQHQEAFFRQGPGHMKAFTQAEAARLLNVHESTISRAVREKYLQCIWGTFPLRNFFPQGMEQRDGICNRIRQLVAGEDSRHPLSDQKISDILTEEGLPVSKRMISKYRAEQQIPDAAGRRKYTE